MGCKMNKKQINKLIKVLEGFIKNPDNRRFIAIMKASLDDRDANGGCEFYGTVDQRSCEGCPFQTTMEEYSEDCWFAIYEQNEYNKQGYWKTFRRHKADLVVKCIEMIGILKA
jgi:hypothetical protein